MELLILFWVGLTTGLSGAMIPGPLFLYTVSEAFREGRWAGVKIAGGHLLLETGFAAAVVLGLRDWLAAAAFRRAMAWVGGLALVAMGALILANVRRLSLARQAHVEFHGGPIAGGAFFSLVSPGFLVWWATIGAAVFLQGWLHGLVGVLLVGAGHALADLGWHGLVAYSVERGRPYCREATYRWIMAGVAACLVVLGIGLPLQGSR
jgi:threonine/homoserine/homoserine lactone efflux protein